MRIVTDSGADLTPEDIARYGLEVAPLFIQFPDGERRSEELTHDAFYDLLDQMRPRIPTTTQPAPENILALYRNADMRQVLSIHISSGLSGTLNAARIAATEMGPGAVEVVDTLTLSGGQRFQVLTAAEGVRAGRPLEAILARLEQVRRATETVFTLDTLEYLARGGRIGRVQSLAGSLLNIKPLINVSHEDGKYNTVGRSRTTGKALADIAAHLERLYRDSGPLWVSVMHGRMHERAEELAQLIRARLPVGRLEVLRVSPVLGVHTGPGVIGAAVTPLGVTSWE